MNYKVLVSEQAERDLGDIYSYICCELKSKSSAERVALRLRGAMIDLSVMPKRYRVYPLEPWLSRIVRFRAVGNYVIFYFVKDAESEVWVTRVVYGKRDMKKHLR
jgi:toxin ParE1/3/4